MTRKTIQFLAAVIIGLVLLLLVLRSDDDYETARSGQLLLPDFKAVANNVTEVAVTRRDEGQFLTVHRRDGRWAVSARSGYPADVSQLRQLIIALADAKIVEEKTSNPDFYEKLGVGAPEEGGKGTTVTARVGENSYSVVFGNTAQGDYRYARIVGEATSYLVDQNPDLPQSANDWLDPDIVDIGSGQVRRVVITHNDGETITIEKTAEEQTDFDVLDIPAGRELSYPTIGNGIAGALGNLELEDVRKRIDGDPATTVVFETWDGLTVTANVVSEEDSFWVGFSATTESGESGAGERVTEINDRVSGWQYRLADHKKNLLTRRWDELLEAPDED